MQSVQVARSRWAPLLASVSEAARATPSRVDAAGLGLAGAGAGQLLLTGIAFEPGAEAVTLSFERLEHRIDRPRQILVERDDATLHRLELVDGAGAHHIVQFTPALELSSP